MKKIKLGIIARDLSKKGGGTKTYSLNILHKLSDILETKDNFEIHVLLNDKSYTKDRSLSNIKVHYIDTNNSIKLEVFEAFKWAKEEKFDVILSFKHFMIPFTWFGLCKLQGITIHDVGYLVSNKIYGFKETIKANMIYMLLSTYNNFVITVSEFSKREIVKYLNIKKSKILVAGSAIEKVKPQNRRLSKNRYFLLINNAKRKNTELVIESFLKIKEEIKEDLYIVGKNSTNLKIDYANNNRIHTLGFVSNEDLEKLYQNATAFIFFSSYEGFGIPLLEAQSNGCPVICSDLKVFKEIGKDSVCIVKNNSLLVLQEEMLNFSKNSKKRNNFIEKGYINCKRFSWQDNAKKILSFIEEEFYNVIL